MDIDKFYRVLIETSAYSSVLPFIMGVIFVRNLKGYLVFLLIFTTIAFIMEGVNYVLYKYEINNLPVFHLYSLLEFSLLSIIYFLFYKQHIKTNYLFLFVILLFFIVAYTEYRINGLSVMDNYSSAIESLILTVYSLFLFFRIMNNVRFRKLLHLPFFWFNSAVLLYFIGNLLSFTFSNYISAYEPENYKFIWVIHSFLNILFNLLIAAAFWETKTK